MKKTNRNFLYATGIVLLVFALVGYWLLLASLVSEKGYSMDVDADDNIDSVQAKYVAVTGSPLTFQVNALLLHYGQSVRTGHFEFRPGEGPLHFVHRLKNGRQDPVRFTVPSVRTKEDFVEAVCQKLTMHPDSLYMALEDTAFCSQYGCDTANILALFIPNTYELYADISVKKFFNRMKKESDAFWNPTRTQLAKAAGLTPQQVITVASIVDEETANNAEKPMVAGMYLNRFKAHMPLQADPTIKYALRQFSLKRIYTNLTFVKSPYNTYRNIGLPPGPIRIPSVAGIDAVLHYAHHDYMYMCANSDFSGTHVFARTYAEHLANAHKYAEALNQRGIK